METCTKKRLIILGAGGCGREVLDIARAQNVFTKEWNYMGFLDYDQDILSGKRCNGEVIGNDENYVIRENDEFICAVGDSALREKIMLKMKTRGAKFINVIHPDAHISDSALLGTGIIIYPNSIVTSNVEIGDGTIINMNCTIAHDVVIHDYVTISPCCNITGGCNIGTGVFMGVGTSLIPNIRIGDHAIICAGSIVMTNVKEERKIMGNPGKVYKQW